MAKQMKLKIDRKSLTDLNWEARVDTFVAEIKSDLLSHVNLSVGY